MTPESHDLSRLRIDRDDRRDEESAPGRRWPWLVLLVVALVGIAVVAWRLRDSRGPEVETAVAQSTGGGAVVASGISASGYVVARTKASVSAKIGGRLVALGVSEGSYARRGAVIARLESADYEAALLAADAETRRVIAELEQAERDFVRARRLREQGVLSVVEVENAQTRVGVLEAQLASARAQVRLAAANLENTRVRAPFDGTILRKDAEVGEIVAPSSAGGGLTRTAIVTMADLTTLEVEVDVNEAFISQVRNGQPARITLDAYADTSFAGRVRQVVPTADRQKATVLVKVSILDRDPSILPEMQAKVVFVAEGDSAVAAAPRRVSVPATAIVREGDAASVWVVESGRVRSRAVTTGEKRGEMIEIRDGLSGGERVIVEPPAGLADGGKIRVREGES
jgi:RND family efflux transporter MFP subunit